MPAQRKPVRFEGFDRRLMVLTGTILLGFLAIAMRLWNLQVAEGEEYRRLAEDVRLTFQRVEAQRGIIYGRNGEREVVLADNRPAYDLILVPAHCDDPVAVVNKLAELVNINGEALLAEVEDVLRRRPFSHVTVKEDVSKNDLVRVEEHAHALRGVFSNVRPERRYPYGETAGQLIGYMGEINRDELARMRDRYRMGDSLGRSGLEARYEDTLRGQDGLMTVVVYAEDQRPQTRTDATGTPFFDHDRFGRKLEEVTARRVSSSPGNPVHTTLDVGLQAYCESLLERQAGAIVVLNADTGAVLAMASVPSYDPSVFVTQGRNIQRAELLNRRPSPMRNRCFQEIYPPGSVFKIVLAAAALETGIVGPQSTRHCPGHFRIDGSGRPWRCWTFDRGGHGRVDMVDSLAYSCDVYFYEVGLDLGVDAIHEYSTLMGLGVSTGLDIAGEVAGVIPSREWKEAEARARGYTEPWELRWYPGDTVNLSIGQGEAAVTPLQTAVMMACVVNGGRRVIPHLGIDNPPAPSEPFLSEETLAIIQEGLLKCVEKETFPSGTGRRAKIEGMTVLGKTGTAQAVAREHYAHYKNEEDIPMAFRNHAWFTAATMGQEVNLSIAILVEHGLAGSTAAAPLARDVILYYYNNVASSAPVTLAQGEES